MAIGASTKCYELWWSDQGPTGYRRFDTFNSRTEAKKAFDGLVLSEDCGYAAVYDMGDMDKALWTFPSAWNGHSHVEGEDRDRGKWQQPGFPKR
jgi:hypothetical protein